MRYIHANPKAAGMRKGYFHAYSNYGIYDRLTDEGLTEWHPAFLSMGQSLDACQRRYHQFCQCYSPKKKKPGRSALGEADCFRAACPKTAAGSFPVKPTCLLKKGAR